MDIDAGEASVEVVRVEYDVERSARAILESDLRREFATTCAGGPSVTTVSER